MSLRAFPVLYARDVERVAAFYVLLGFEEHVRLPGEGGDAGFIGLRRGNSELAVTTEASPRALAGVEPGPGPRHELFVYVDDVDATLAAVRRAGATLLREPADMPWGERLAFVGDFEDNVVTLAMPQPDPSGVAVRPRAPGTVALHAPRLPRDNMGPTLFQRTRDPLCGQRLSSLSARSSAC